MCSVMLDELDTSVLLFPQFEVPVNRCSYYEISPNDCYEVFNGGGGGQRMGLEVNEWSRRCDKRPPDSLCNRHEV